MSVSLLSRTFAPAASFDMQSGSLMPTPAKSPAYKRPPCIRELFPYKITAPRAPLIFVTRPSSPHGKEAILPCVQNTFSSRPSTCCGTMRIITTYKALNIMLAIMSEVRTSNLVRHAAALCPMILRLSIYSYHHLIQGQKRFDDLSTCQLFNLSHAAPRPFYHDLLVSLLVTVALTR